MSQGGRPFVVGRVSPTKGFVHVFDEASLRLLLSELDTVSDFVGYLSRREALMESGKLEFAAGEEGLLGWYVHKIDKDQTEHDFVVRDGVILPVAIDESWWVEYQRSDERRRKLDADRISYLWDEIIERFTKHFMEGTSDYLTEATTDSHERTLRMFARESRLRRRVLAKSLMEMLKTTPVKDMRRLRVVPPSSPGDPYWVLLLVPMEHSIPYRVYRDGRRAFLEMCLGVVKLTWPDATDIVGYATETGDHEGRSEDAVYMDARSWTNAHNEAARQDRDRFKILLSARQLRISEREYPDKETVERPAEHPR